MRKFFAGTSGCAVALVVVLLTILTGPSSPGVDPTDALVAHAKPGTAMSASIFQQLYDSEINFEILCFWDAKFDVRGGDAVNNFLAQDNVPT
jgi:hypothetical protein